MHSFTLQIPQVLHPRVNSQGEPVQPKIEFELGSNNYYLNGDKHTLPTEVKHLISKGIEGFKSTVLNQTILVTLFEEKDVLCI